MNFEPFFIFTQICLDLCIYDLQFHREALGRTVFSVGFASFARNVRFYWFLIKKLGEEGIKTKKKDTKK